MATKPTFGQAQYRDKNKSFEENYGNYQRDLLLWEQAEAMEKNNELAQQKIEEARAQEFRTIEREYRALGKEREFMENLQDIKDDIVNSQSEIEQNRQLHDKLMRYQRLCDDMGLDYEEIKKLELWLENPTNEQWEKYIEVEKQYKNFIETEEIELLYEEKKKKTDEYKITKETHDKNMEELSSIFNKSEDEIYAENYISVSGLNNLSGGTEEELEDVIGQNISSIKILSMFLCSIIFAIVLLCSTEIFIYALFIGIFLSLIILDRIIKLKNGKKIMEEAIFEHQKEIAKEDKKREEVAIKCDKLEEEIDKLDSQISKLEQNRQNELKNNKEYLDIKEKRDMLYESLIKGTKTLNQKEFYEFRRNHFNDDIERLFRKLGLKNIQTVKKEEILHYGQVEDYRTFIEDVILNIDDLYFEDYEAYYMEGVRQRLFKAGNSANI